MDNSFALLQSARDEQARWSISLWEALILAAARACGAGELITEDFSHRQDYNGVKVINQFHAIC